VFSGSKWSISYYNLFKFYIILLYKHQTGDSQTQSLIRLNFTFLETILQVLQIRWCNLIKDSVHVVSRERGFTPVLRFRMFIFWGWKRRVESLDASRKENAGASFVAEDCLSCIHTNGSRQTQARSATRHVRYNYQHLAHKALHCIRYERACRSTCSAVVIFSARAPTTFFTIHLTARTLNFLETTSMILESTIKGGLYRHFQNFII